MVVYFQLQRNNFTRHTVLFYNKSQRNALFLKFILIKNSTCFGQIYCPSSGVLTLYTQQQVFVMLLMLTVCQRGQDRTHQQTNLRNSASRWLYYKNISQCTVLLMSTVYYVCRLYQKNQIHKKVLLCNHLNSHTQLRKTNIMQHSHLQTANSKSDQYKIISRYRIPQFTTNTSLCSRNQMFNAINTKVHHWTES